MIYGGFIFGWLIGRCWCFFPDHSMLVVPSIAHSFSPLLFLILSLSHSIWFLFDSNRIKYPLFLVLTVAMLRNNNLPIINNIEQIHLSWCYDSFNLRLVAPILPKRKKKSVIFLKLYFCANGRMFSNLLSQNDKKLDGESSNR